MTAPLPLVLVLPAALAAAVALVPLAYLAVRALEDGPAAALDLLARARTARLVAGSLALAAVVTAACLVVGLSAAWLVERSDLPWRRGWRVVLALPLAVPSYVAAFAWLAADHRVQGMAGAALVLTTTSYPYVYLSVVAALRRTDPALEEVARSLGHGPVRTAVGVTLRSARPAAAAGGLLVALYVLSDFGAVSILRADTFTRVIYTAYRASFDRTPAAVLACVLVAVTVLVVLVEGRARGRADSAPVGSGTRAAPPVVALGRWRVAAAVWLGLVVAVSLGVPAVSLAGWLVRGSSAADAGQLVAATAATVLVAGLGALLTTALALPVGVLAARHRGRAVQVLEQAAYAGHALPGIVVALSVVFLGVRVLTPLYQRTPLLLLAYAVLFLPLAVGAVRTAVAQSPPRLEEAARALGRTPLQVLREVTLPLAAPGVAAGFALVFLAAAKELPATLLLRPTGTDTLATELWSATSTGRYAEAAPAAALLVVLAALPTALLAGPGARRDAVAP